jgi:Icc-related predicted phosphoesterase
MSVSVENVKKIVNNFTKKGVAYIIGLYPFLYSRNENRYNNVISTLEPVFGRNIAETIYSEIEEAFKDLDMSIKVKIKNRKEELGDYLKRFILKGRIPNMILKEVEERLKRMPKEDKKVLSVACAIINAIKNKNYPVLTVRNNNEFISIYSQNKEYFSEVVSSVLGFDIPNVRTLFYKYLLGFQSDLTTYHQNYYELKIYPFIQTYFEKLASEVTKYIKILSRSAIESKLNKIYQKGQFLKLAVLQQALFKDAEDLEFLLHFYHVLSEQWFYKRVSIKGIINKGFVNPLIYDHVREIISIMNERASKELMELFISVFKKAGYTAICENLRCIFVKPSSKPIHIFFSAWPEKVYITDARESIKVIVMQGIPQDSILQYLEKYKTYYKECIWLFLNKEKRRVVIATLNKSKSGDHQELLDILRKKFPKVTWLRKKFLKVIDVSRLGLKEELGLREDLIRNIIELRHQGPLKILAFSDYKVHDMKILIDFISSFKDRPDIIIYAGDDVKRFIHPPLKLLYIPDTVEEYPQEIEVAKICYPNTNLPMSIDNCLILRVPQGAYTNDYLQKRLLMAIKLINRIQKILKNLNARFDISQQLATLEKIITEEFPFLIIKKDENEVKIIDKFTKTEILRLTKFFGNKLILAPNHWESLQAQLNEISIRKIERKIKDTSYEYYVIIRPKYNYFELLASYAKYGLAVILGNDDESIYRVWIDGKKIYKLHNTWLKIGSYLIIGLEGTTDGMGPLGYYPESDRKDRLRLANAIIRSSNEKLIIVSHAPPKGILDRAMQYGEASIGSLELRNFIEEYDRPVLVICGHVHRCGGQYEKLNQAIVANVSSHDSYYERANIAWIIIDERGTVNIEFIKLPSVVEYIFKSESKANLLETLKKRTSLSESEAKLFIDTYEKVKDKFFDDLSALAHLKFKYGFSWYNVFQLYLHGVKAPEQLTEDIYRNILNSTKGIYKTHLMRGYVNIKKELSKGKVYLINQIPLPSHNKVIICDIEYSLKAGVLYGFLDLSTGELKQFWFDEKEKARQYLKDKQNYLFVYWGGSDKKLLKEELGFDTTFLNLLYYVQISLVAPIPSASLHYVYDVLCGHNEDEWWKMSFYGVDGFYKLMLCDNILMNPNDNYSREKLKDINKADILALSQVFKKLRELNSGGEHYILNSKVIEGLDEVYSQDS